MKVATQNTADPRGSSEPTGSIQRATARMACWVDDLSVSEKLCGIVASLVVVTILLLAMSIQSLRLQSSYQHMEASSARAANGIGRVNALVYAVVMESRGIYMSTDRGMVKQYAEALLKRNRELAIATLELEETVRGSEVGEFPTFKERILQFIDFREELARRALVIGPGAARVWGDNDANRALRSQLNVDLESLAEIYRERAREAAQLGDLGQYACWYLFGLGLAALLLAAVNLKFVRRSVVEPLAEIIRMSNLIARGDIKSEIPFFGRRDEIGQLANALRRFQEALDRNQELLERELDAARQRGAIVEQCQKYSDRYLVTKWQLSAAINSISQGMIMLDSKANVVVVNDRYREMYGLPATVTAGSSHRDVLQHGISSGQFVGDAEKHLQTIMARISKRQPMSVDIKLHDGRTINVQENPIDGGGWVAMHDDITEQHQHQRILKRTEHFLATIVENIPEGIVAKDARNLRYIYVNKAAEAMIGMARADMIGKTARDLFSAKTAELIERRDRQLLAEAQQPEPITDTMDGPGKGVRTIAVRRLQIGGPDDESHLFVSMFEDRTDVGSVALPPALLQKSSAA
jgi:PAS domain S-box-containing protein